MKMVLTSKREKELLSALKQARNDLINAHGEICKLQGLDPVDFGWPEWTPQANTIRWIDNLLSNKVVA